MSSSNAAAGPVRPGPISMTASCSTRRASSPRCPACPSRAVLPASHREQCLCSTSEHYAATFRLPVRTSTEVVTLRRDDGRWHARTVTGETFSAESAVVATGIVANPWSPDIPYRHRFDGRVLHSVEYRRPDTLARAAGARRRVRQFSRRDRGRARRGRRHRHRLRPRWRSGAATRAARCADSVPLGRRGIPAEGCATNRGAPSSAGSIE